MSMSSRSIVSEAVTTAVNERHGSLPSQYRGTVDAVVEAVTQAVDEAVARAIDAGVDLGATRAQAEGVFHEAGLLQPPQQAQAQTASASASNEGEVLALLQQISTRLEAVERTAESARSRYGIS